MKRHIKIMLLFTKLLIVCSFYTSSSLAQENSIDLYNCTISDIYIGDENQLLALDTKVQISSKKFNTYEGNIDFIKIADCINIYFKDKLLSNLIVENIGKCTSFSLKFLGESIRWDDTVQSIISKLTSKGLSCVDRNGSLMVEFINAGGRESKLLFNYNDNSLSNIKLKVRSQ